VPLIPKNYPKEYSEQEKVLMDQISARRKAYMQKYGAAESEYTKAYRSRVFKDRVHSYDYEIQDKGAGPDDMAIAKHLFR
jgi:hypothetical protein